MSDSEAKKPRGRPKAPKDAGMTLMESFDQHKLNHIIENFASLRQKMRPKYFEDGKDPLAVLKKYLNKSKNGCVDVKYKQNASKGRFYAIGALSLQTHPREVRHTIASDYYVDIDVKNAHPVILAHLCEENGWSHKLLRKYNENRDEFLSKISPSKELAKMIVLSLVNGGVKDAAALENPPDFLKDFATEMTQIHKKFAKKYPKEFAANKKARDTKDKSYNYGASFMNTLLCDFENNILQTIWRTLGSPKDCVLCFDGLMIRKEDQGGAPIDLDHLCRAVKSALEIEIELAVKPMTEGLELGKVEYYVPAVSNQFDFTDPYCYNDFRNEFNGAKFSDSDEADDALSKYKKVIAHVSQGKGFFVKKLTMGRLDMVPGLGSSCFKFMIAGEKVSFESYIGSKPSFRELDCYLQNCPEDVFNAWTGFQAKRVAKPESPGLRMMKDFIMDTWANNDEVHYNYIVSWFAGVVANLDGINGTALAMISEQGTGKTTLLEFMELVLRTVNTISVEGVDRATGRFNMNLKFKRLVNVNEMSSNRETFRDNFNIMKARITEGTMSLEPKGIDPFPARNIGNYVLFTNHKDAISVEESDRRYAIFEMGKKYINDFAFFEELRRVCFTQDVADEFYTYLLDFKRVNLKQIINTDLREELKQLSKSSPLRFLDAIGEDPELRSQVLPDGVSRVSTGLLYQQYKMWCEACGERGIQTSTKFGTTIGLKLEKVKSSGRISYIFPTPP